jgi:SNF2 family DNA or RNA helicase
MEGEETKRGGILADDMGLGKTIQRYSHWGK